MPADYKSRGTHKQKKPMPGFVWLLIGLTIGLFVALIVYLDKQPASDVSFNEAVQKELDKLRKTEVIVKQREQKKPAHPDSEPKFNFYTILPELEVLIPDTELKVEGDDQGTDNTTTTNGKRYILQAGSFKNRQDADRLKASLALLGMEASIQSVSIDRAQWHRVRVGPFSTTRALHKSLNQLQNNGINAMAMELKAD